MEKASCLDSYPLRVVFLSNLVAVSIYGIGAYLLWKLGLLLAILFLVYCLALEIRVLKISCVECYYYGKACAFGKGKVCALFFRRRGGPEEFARHEISWLTLVPDFLVGVFPIVGGIILLVKDFSWLPLVLVLVFLVLATAGNGIVRGAFACKYCKQREIGCPAERRFGKGKGASQE